MPALSSCSATIRPSPPFAPPPHTTVQRTASRNSTCATACRLRPGALHQLRRRAGIPGIPRFGGAHLVCGVERLELSHRWRRRPPARARANASLRDRSRARRAAPPTTRRGPRGERTASAGRRSRCPSTRTRARRRSRAPCRRLPCPRTVRRSSPRGSARESQYACSSAVKQRSRKRGYRSSERRMRAISIRSVPTLITGAPRATPADARATRRCRPAGARDRSTSSGRNFPVRTSTVAHADALRADDVALEVVADHPRHRRVGVERLARRRRSTAALGLPSTIASPARRTRARRRTRRSRASARASSATSGCGGGSRARRRARAR